MKSNFNDCLNRLLKDEGGYSNHPSDPGGPTNFGITIFDYQKYINKKGTAIDVKNMRVEDAKQIYKTKYWDALGCDSLPPGVDYTCFDYGVNSGLGRPQKALKRFSGLAWVPLINAINDERMTFLRGLNTFPVFGKGWTRRVSGVRAHSLELANQKDQTTGPAVAAATVGVGTAISQYWHTHEVLIIISAVVVAAIVGTLIHFYKNRK